MRHELKIWPQYFYRVKDGSKTFEVRKNDRGFQMGDHVVLVEYNPEEIIESHKYTGNELEFKIGYVLPIDAERVVFSLIPIPEVEEGVFATGSMTIHKSFPDSGE